MKESLMKTRYGIPAALLILLFAAGTVVATVTVIQFNPTTTTEEPIAVGQDDGFEIGYPGESDTITYSISNASSNVIYGMVVDVDDGSQIESVSYSVASSSNIEIVKQGNVSGDGDADSYDAHIDVGTSADGNGSDDDLTITVDTKAGVAPGEISLTVDFIRNGEAWS